MEVSLMSEVKSPDPRRQNACVVGRSKDKWKNAAELPKVDDYLERRLCLLDALP
ncbi:unnamed protein product, partial [Ectocarpus fasciculatus]